MTDPSSLRIVAHLQSLARVDLAEELLAWVDAHLKGALLQGAFACGMTRLGSTSMTPVIVLSANAPVDFLPFLRQPASMEEIARNLEGDEVFTIDTGGTANPKASGPWHEYLGRSKLRSMAVHGIVEFSRQYASWFGFLAIPQSFGEDQRRLLKLYVPHMHLALMRILRRPRKQHAPGCSRRTLTARELEVLAWICEGKTSTEIAAIHGVAVSTVRNQVQSILVKLRVNTQAQAAARAMHEGLVAPATGYGLSAPR